MRLNRRAFLAAVAIAPAATRTTWIFAAESAVDLAYERLLAEYTTRQKTFSQDLRELADECESLGYAPDARDLRELAEPMDDQSLAVNDLPDEMRPEISRNFPADQRSIRVRQRSLQDDYANDLMQMSVRARQKQQISLAWRLVQEAAFHNPDHEKARALLGFVKQDGRWMTPFRRKMLKEGNVWHEQFGWLPENDVARYEAGERNYRGRWMSAAREASIRSDFRNAWEASSEHFLVRTNQSLERAVEISVKLERFHEFFVRSFSAVFMTPQQLQQLFEGGLSGSPQPPRPHIVHYFRDKQEFVEALRKKQPEAAFSNGIYLPHPPDRRSYFFHRPDALEEVDETMYHETTHQILSESVRKPVDVGAQANFWLVEGLACYLESFRPDRQRGSVGDPRHTRILWARKFLLEEKKYVPMGPFTGMGQREFQCMDMPNDETRFRRLQQYYAQAAGVAHFFCHYRGGIYREALVRHLAEIYSPDQRTRGHAATLEELTETPFAMLDQQYIDYMAGLP